MENQGINQNENVNQEPFNNTRSKPMNGFLAVLIGFAAGIFSCGLGFVVPVIGLISIVTVLLATCAALIVYACCGEKGFAAFEVTYTAGVLVALGAIPGAALVAAVTLPCLVMVIMDWKRLPFFKRLYGSLGVQILGYIAALGLLTAFYGQNLGELAGNMLRSSFSAVSEDYKAALAEFYKMYYSAMQIEIPYDAADEILESIAVFSTELIKLSGPVILLVLASVNVFPGVALSSKIRYNRGAEGETWEPLKQWRMKPPFVYGLILLCATGFIMSKVYGVRGEVVLYTALSAVSVAGIIQYLASWCDRFTLVPGGKAFKIIMLVIEILFFTRLLPVFGAASMLMGKQGIISGAIRKYRDRHSGGGNFPPDDDM